MSIFSEHRKFSVGLDAKQISLVWHISNEVFNRDFLSEHQKNILYDLKMFSYLDDYFYKIHKSRKSLSDIILNFKELVFLRNMIIVAILAYDQYDDYYSYLFDHDFYDCLKLLRFIDIFLYEATNKINDTYQYPLNCGDAAILKYLCNEVLRGVSLCPHHRRLCKWDDSGEIFERKISHIDDQQQYIELTRSDLDFIRNALIVAMLRLDENTLYESHLGCSFEKCLDLMRIADSLIWGNEGAFV